MSANNRHTWANYESPFGKFALTASRRGLDGLFFPGRAPSLAEADLSPERFEQALRQLDECFAGTRCEFDLSLDLSLGTRFQQAVWRELQAIPDGAAITYGELAAKTGRPDRVRAAGAAVGRNPLPIVVPCHRVVASDGIIGEPVSLCGP